MKSVLFCILLLVIAIPHAHAGAGAFVRIYNLTGYSLNCSASLDGFDNDGGKSGALSGTLAPSASFPREGTVYIEEKNLILDSRMTIKVSAEGKGEASLAVRYRHSYQQVAVSNSAGLRMSSAISSDPAVNGGGNQAIISIFVSDRDISPLTWMSQLKDSLRLSHLLIPGTHDTAAYRVAIYIPFLHTQSYFIRKQLEAGARYFDLRGGYPTNDDIKCVHDKTEVSGDDTWDHYFYEAFEFLKRHPQEVVIFQLKMDNGGGDGDINARPALERYLHKYRSYIYSGPFTRSYTGARRLILPTLGDARGRMVFVSRLGDNATNGLAPLQFKINAGFHDNAVSINPHYAVQDKYQPTGGPHEKEAAVNDFFAKTRRNNLLNINFLSASVPPSYSPADFAEGKGTFDVGVNLYTARFLNNRDYYPNFDAAMLMDFIQPDDPLAKLGYMLNFLRDGKSSSEATAGNTYYFWSKASPSRVIDINIGADSSATVHRIHPGSSVYTWQQFKLIRVGSSDAFRLIATNRQGRPLYLSNSDGEHAVTSPVPVGTSTSWTIEPDADTAYVRVRSLFNKKLLTVESDDIKDGSKLVLADETNSARQLWLVDDIGPNRPTR